MSSAGPVSWNKLIPGSTIDLTELNNNRSLVTEPIFNESFVNDREILNFETSKVDINDDQCRLNRIDSLLQFQSCPAVVLNRNGKQILSFFECKLEQESYGVDKKYLAEQYFLMDGRLCHVGRRLQLKTNQFYVINLDSDDFDSNIENNVFVGENIVLRRGSGTHYISAVHFGDCLYQAEVLHLYQRGQNKTITRGRLLSASGNSGFENWAENLINDAKSELGFRQIYIEQKLQENLVKGFKADQLLKMLLVPLFKKHPVPKKPIFKKVTNENLFEQKPAILYDREDD
ncbi:uncharacterized protein LOC128668654 [Microplitis demolitor]|uniref:uncharacterized protein LOC128668654 n=1 Tax=Microplitis demolitor TaxID=69319 RepID=UPI00235B652B|nr:uncharacterized protein LOC128668654 [Microplitis demolitor]